MPDRPTDLPPTRSRGLTPGRLAAFGAGAAPAAVLGFQYGGYFVDVVAAYAIGVWCVLFLSVLSGVLAPPRPTPAGWAALGGAGVLCVWGGSTLGWSASPERGLTEVVRTVAIAGTLLLGLAVVASGHSRFLLGGVLTGLAAIVVAAVAARLLPELIPQAWDGRGVPTDRLSWPLQYWNGLGAAAAMVIAVGPAVAARARGPWTSGAAVALLPVALLALALTLSRGGVVAAVLGLAFGVATVRPRLILLRSLVAPLIAGAVLIAVVWSRDAIPDAVGGLAGQDAGAPLVPLVLLATVAVGIVQGALYRADAAELTPRVPRPGRRTVAIGAAATIALAIGGFVAGGGPERASDAWRDFKQTPLSETGTSASRLGSAGGSGRYAVWSGALDAATAQPLKGIGLGSWETWWTPRRDGSVFVRNAHSHPLEVFAETGLIGLAALLTLLMAPFAGAATVLRRRDAAGRDAKRGRDAVAAVPLVAALVAAVAVDWSWQLSVLPVLGLLGAAPLLGRRAPSSRVALPPADAPVRRVRAAAVPVTLTVLTVAAVAVSAVASVARDGVQRSAEEVRAGRFDAAAQEARATAEAVPFALSPAMQHAAVLERAGRLGAAASAAREATDREPRNWRPWALLARIQAVRGRRADALEALARARSLNPSFPILGAGAPLPAPRSVKR